VKSKALEVAKKRKRATIDLADLQRAKARLERLTATRQSKGLALLTKPRAVYTRNSPFALFSMDAFRNKSWDDIRKSLNAGTVTSDTHQIVNRILLVCYTFFTEYVRDNMPSDVLAAALIHSLRYDFRASIIEDEDRIGIGILLLQSIGREKVVATQAGVPDKVTTRGQWRDVIDVLEAAAKRYGANTLI